jgi:hypothetical protein
MASHFDGGRTQVPLGTAFGVLIDARPNRSLGAQQFQFRFLVSRAICPPVINLRRGTLLAPQPFSAEPESMPLLRCANTRNTRTVDKSGKLTAAILIC